MRLLAALFLTTMVGCGASVTPLDPRDPSLPPESQQWLAAAQDGVIAARAQRDSAAAELRRLRDWAERVTTEAQLDGRAERRLGSLADARVAFAEAELEEAEREVVFAEAKLKLAYAERSVHHDLGRYELEPIEQEVDEARAAADAARRRREQTATRVLQATDEFRTSYAELAQGGGSTRTFWIGQSEPVTEVIEEEAGDDESDEPSGDDEPAEEDEEPSDG